MMADLQTLLSRYPKKFEGVEDSSRHPDEGTLMEYRKEGDSKTYYENKAIFHCFEGWREQGNPAVSTSFADVLHLTDTAVL